MYPVTGARGRGGYGPSMLASDTTKSALQTVRFSPVIAKSGKYSAYIYFPKLPGLSSQIPLVVSDGRKEKPVTIKTSDIEVVGQTSGEWVFIGTYDISKGQKAYIEISNKGANGLIFADAVMMVPASN